MNWFKKNKNTQNTSVNTKTADSNDFVRYRFPAYGEVVVPKNTDDLEQEKASASQAAEDLNRRVSSAVGDEMYLHYWDVSRID